MGHMCVYVLLNLMKSWQNGQNSSADQWNIIWSIIYEMWTYYLCEFLIIFMENVFSDEFNDVCINKVRDRGIHWKINHDLCIVKKNRVRERGLKHNSSAFPYAENH